MNDTKLEGTLRLDGLIEGRLPKDPGGEAALREWVAFASSLYLRFGLEIDGNSFGLLADNAPVHVADLGRPPADLIADALRQLLKVFRPEERSDVFSTLRGIEYRPGLEVQLLFLVAPDGTVSVREEATPAATVAPREPLTRREKIRLAAIGLGVALALFGLSALFVDYGALWSNIVTAVRPFDTDAVQVDATTFKKYITVTKKEPARGNRAMLVTLQRRVAFPRTDEDIQKRLDSNGIALTERLALEALARGYVRCEYFDKDGKFVAHTDHRVRGLRNEATVTLRIPISRSRPPARLRITF
jgi:hypothetical protein